MRAAGREAAPYFSHPVRQGVMMLAVLGLVAFGVSLAWPRVAPVFLANPYLNGFIALVFAIGVLACFWQLLQIIGSVRWVVDFTGGRPGTTRHAPRLLAPLATLLRERGARRRIGAASARSILDSVATRIDEARDITRYIVNLLIFLGLLGTFYGLATTVPAVVDTIRSLAPQEGEGSMAVFDRLMGGLEAQLGGMGVAFSSSLLGLAGSLVVGLLELFASHGQNRFYRQLEEWLSTITRLGFAADEGAEGAAGTGAEAMPALVDTLSERLEAMQALFSDAEAGRAVTDRRLVALAGAVEGLAQRLGREGESGSATEAALARVAEGQERLVALLEKAGAGGLDAESRMRLRSIDVQMLRLLEEVSAGREESVAELRSDIAALARALRPGGVGAAPQPVPPVRRGGHGAG